MNKEKWYEVRVNVKIDPKIIKSLLSKKKKNLFYILIYASLIEEVTIHQIK